MNSLKEAVTDAERRVGEALEEIRELKDVKADLQAEKDAWGSRDKEMQNVLRKVKEEVMWADRERDQVQQKLEESEARCLEAEARTVEVECQLAGLENSDAMTASGKGIPDDPNNVGESVRIAVLKLAQDLHGLYKSKHELKIESLKESYKRRYGRQIGTLETKVADLIRENDDLRVGKDISFSRVVPADLVPPPAETRINPVPEQDQHAIEERAMEAKRREEQDAKLHDLEQELASTKRNNEALLTQLEMERLGMAELVAATEEMMQLSEVGAVAAEGPASKSLETLRGSISRASSGLKVPNGNIGGGLGPGAGFGESRIGKFGAGRGFGMPAGGGGGLGVGTRSGFKGNS